MQILKVARNNRRPSGVSGLSTVLSEHCMNCRAIMEISGLVPITTKFTDSVDVTTNGNILKEKTPNKFVGLNQSPNVLDRLIFNNANQKLQSDTHGSEGSSASGNSSVHQCTKCERSFPRLPALRRHEKNCGIPPYFFCKFCPYENKHRGDLKSHIKFNHRDKIHSSAEFEKMVNSIIEEGKKLQASALEALHSRTPGVVKPKHNSDTSSLMNRYCGKCAKVCEKRKKNCPECQTAFLYECKKCRKRSKHYSVMYNHTKRGCRFESSFQLNDSRTTPVKRQDQGDMEESRLYIDENDDWNSLTNQSHSGAEEAENLSISSFQLLPAHTSNLKALDMSISEQFRDAPKMYDFLTTAGSQQDFWEQLFTRRVMDAIRSNELGMMTAAKLLGVSYGTLYNRYRNNYG